MAWVEVSGRIVNMTVNTIVMFYMLVAKSRTKVTRRNIGCLSKSKKMANRTDEQSNLQCRLITPANGHCQALLQKFVGKHPTNDASVSITLNSQIWHWKLSNMTDNVFFFCQKMSSEIFWKLKNVLVLWRDSENKRRFKNI